MTAGYSDLRRWQDVGVRGAATCIRGTIRSLNSAGATMATETIPKEWSGKAAVASATIRNRLRDQIENQARIRKVLADQIDTTANGVRSVRERITQLDQQALDQQFRVADDGTITDEFDYLSEFFKNPGGIWNILRQRKQVLTALEQARTMIQQLAQDIDTVLAEALRTAMSNEDPAGPFGLPPQATQDRWSQLTDEQRRTILRNIAAELAQQYGVTNYSVEFGPLEEGTWGQYDPSTGVLTINSAYLDDPAIINTIVHETMHAGHDQNLDNFPGLTEEEREELRDNSGSNYEGYDENDPETWDDYRYQPEEDITRRDADDWVEGLSPEELEQYL